MGNNYTMQITSNIFSKKRLILFLIPIFTLIVSFGFLKQLLPFYMSVPDPSYIHLFNGINLAGGNMEVGNTDNPGTTIQCFAAVVIFIKHLFSFSHGPVSQDVMLNSEGYLYACSASLIILFVCINYLTGAYIFRYTGNVGLSLLFQITPLININIIRRVIVLEPEAAIIIAATFFMAYLFIKAPENLEITRRLNNKTIILFALFSGFLIASKYTCAPVVFLILFILEKNKQRLLYLAMVAVSFMLFIIPALPKIGSMCQWVWGLITHDGIYGKGAERIINPSQYTHNLKELFITDTIFTSIYCIITLAFLIAFLQRLGKRKAVPFFRAISGLWISITTLILVVAKHCDFHYLVFAECCFPFGMAISYKIFSAFFFQSVSHYKKYEKSMLYLIFTLFSIFLVVEKIRYLPMRHPQPLFTDKYMAGYKTLPRIISIKSSTECELIEPSLYLGDSFSGSLQDAYGRFLNKIYPNTYIYWDGTQNLLHWNETLTIPDFFSKKSGALVYMKGFDRTSQTNLLNKFCTANGTRMQGKCKVQKIYSDSGTVQSIYLIAPLDTAIISKI